MVNRSATSRKVKILIGVFVAVFFIFATKELMPTSEVGYIPLENVEIAHSFTPEATELLSDEESADGQVVYRLNKYDIEEGLHSSFMCRGLKMEKQPILTVGDMMIPLTAYDPVYKIGYILVEPNLFGEGILESSYTEYQTQKEAERKFLTRVDRGIELYMENEDRFIEDIFGDEPVEPIDEDEELEGGEPEPENIFPDFSNMNFKDQKAFFEFVGRNKNRMPRGYKPIDKDNVRRKWDFFKEAYSDEQILYDYGQEIKDRLEELQTFEDKYEYLEIVFIDLKKKIYLDQLRAKESKTIIDEWKLSAADIITDPIRFFGFMEILKTIGATHQSELLTRAMNEEIFKILITHDKKRWWKHSQALISLFQANKVPGINSKYEFDDLLATIITEHPYEKWKDQYYKIEDLGNKYSISKEELKALPSLAATHGISIAPLSILDKRTIYNMEEQLYQDNLEELRVELAVAKNKKQKKAIQKELRSYTEYRSTHYGEIRAQAKSKTMNVLIKDMEHFLDWAEVVSVDWRRKNGV